MDKFTCLAIAVCVLLACAATTEAASPVKTLAPKVVRVVTGIPTAVGKAGDGVSNWLWKNKGTVTMAVVVGTFAMQPEPFVEAASGVATATAEKTVEAIVPQVGERIASTTGGYTLLAALVATLVLAMLYEQGGRSRFFAKCGFGVLLLIGVLVLLGGVAGAAEIDCRVPTTTAGLFAINWRLIVDAVLIILTLIPLG